MCYSPWTMKNPLGKPRRAKVVVTTPKPPAPVWPMRINRLLAERGIATRRAADELVEKGVIFINGRKAVIGQKVNENDEVEVRRRGGIVNHTYVAFHKPAGMDTHNEPGAKESIIKSLPLFLQKLKLFPVGRLDKDSRGLIILTNDGRITDRLLNPDRFHEKTYDVKTKLALRSTFKDKMSEGVNIEGYMTRPARVQILGDKRFRITLTEGKSHQIRRMVSALFNEVQDLKRIQILNVHLGPLPVSMARKIEGEELDTFLDLLGVQRTEPSN
jgi:23S rRNA pseudouridine2604 synthase